MFKVLFTKAIDLFPTLLVASISPSSAGQIPVSLLINGVFVLSFAICNGGIIVCSADTGLRFETRSQDLRFQIIRHKILRTH